MQLNTRESNQTYIISLNGRIIADSDTVELREVVREALINGHTKIVVDMGGVDWINSTGIAALIQAYTMLKEINGQLRLARVNDAVINVLTINKLTLVFDIHPSIEEAMTAMHQIQSPEGDRAI